MDLRAWLLDTHADLRTRVFGSIVHPIPRDVWTEQADQGGSSITWLLLHLARHQDLAVTTVIRNHAPLYLQHREALGLADAPTWAGLSESEDREVSILTTPDTLVDYVTAVFDATGRWLDHVGSMAMDIVPDSGRRLEQLALLPRDSVPWLFDMWRDRPIDWFVRWPVFGHGQNHLGEMISVRNRLGLSPF